MLQNIRDKTSGWLTGIIVGVICVMFALWGVSYYLGDMVSTQQSVATVNGTPITQGAVNQAYQQLQNQQNPSNRAPANVVKQEALTQLIKQQLLLQDAQAMGMSVTEDQIDQAIYSLPALQSNGKFSPALYQQLLQNLNMTTPELRQQLRINALINQYRMGVLVSDFALPNEVNQYAALSNETRSFGYVTVPVKAFKSRVQVSTQEAQAYYQSHLQEYMAPEQVKLAYLLLSLPDIQKNIQVSDADAQTYYQSNAAQFITPEQRQVAQIVLKANDQATAEKIEADLKAGQSFAALAKQYSQDPISAAKGGDLGWVKQADLPQAFGTAAFALPTVGAVSAPLPTSFGIQIIQLEGIKPAQAQSFASVKAQIIQNLQAQEAQAQFTRRGNDLANLTFENPNSLDAAASALHLTVQTTAPFDKMGAATGMAANPAVVKAAFSDSVLAQGNNSDVIMIGTDQALVVRVLQDYSAHQLSFDQAKAKVIAQLTQLKATQAAQMTAQTLMKAIQSGGNPKTIASQQQLTWTLVSNVKRDNTKQPAALLQAVFAAPAPQKSLQANLIQNAQGFTIYAVTKVTSGVVNSTSVSSAQNTVQNLFAAQSYLGYMNALQSNAQVKVNQP